MKILAIRGENLASLAGRFELNFQNQPLANTGLFAIYGPTGSGKSTLLDALCLALFGETPRLSSAIGKAQNIDSDVITPSDPRNLLRRGCGAGYAEVDFFGKDGISYRARWIVRRAHDKPNGKLQNSMMYLKRIDDDQSLGGKNDEVKALIRDLLGLDFEQFRRSVLLAQNEFAVFLRADDDKRAELLETLTGLAICTSISKGAHQRAKEEQAAFDTLQEQCEKLAVLSPEQRADHEQQLQILKEQNANLTQQIKILTDAEQWYKQLDALQTSVQEAAVALDKLQFAQHQAQPRYKRLILIEEVQGARRLVENVDNWEKDIQQQKFQLDYAQQEWQKLKNHYQQLEIDCQNFTDALARAKNEQETAKYKIDQVRLLDKEIECFTIEEQKSLILVNNTRNDLTRIEEELTQKNTAQEKLEMKLKKSQEWLSAHAAFSVLSEHWPRWELLLTNALKIQNELPQSLKNNYTKEREQKNAQGNLTQASTQYANAMEELEIAEMKLKISSQGTAQFNRDQLVIQRKNLETRRSQLNYAEKLSNEREYIQSRSTELTQDTNLLNEKIQQIKLDLTQIKIDQEFWSPQLAAKEQLLKTTAAACVENIEIARAQLKSGQPCPVCGSCEHPYTGTAPTRSLLAVLENEVDDLRKKVDALSKQEIINQTTEKNYQDSLEKIAQEQENQRTALHRNTLAWNAQPLAAEFTAPEQISCTGWLQDQLQINQAQLKQIEEQEIALRAAQQEEEKARNMRDHKHQRFLSAEKEKNAAQFLYEQSNNNLKAAQECYAQLTKELVDYQKSLDAAFISQDWRQHWRTNANEFCEKQRQNKDQWNEAMSNVREWEIQIKEIKWQIDYQKQSLPDKKQQLQEANTRYQEIKENLTELQRQRHDLFPELEIAVIEANFARKLAHAQQKVESQELKLKSVHEEILKDEAALEHKKEYLEISRNKAQQANNELNNWIVSFNIGHPDDKLDITQLRTLLTVDEQKFKQERADLLELKRQESEAGAIYQDRKNKFEEHEQKHPQQSLDEIQKQSRNSKEQLKIMDYEIEKKKVLLQDNDNALIKFEELHARKITQEKKTTLWKQLDAAIGAHDGKKFREYAQQFTLGVLLNYANLHLTAFSRRYRLEQIPNTLSLMVIDQDMGDSRRSVHSLSGGETFLASLALALGLASLSAHQIRVESLFIDEGFGSLDAETLRVAMDALDNLQAQGRKVGIISHLREMTERIAVRIHVHQQSGGRSQLKIYGFM